MCKNFMCVFCSLEHQKQKSAQRRSFWPDVPADIPWETSVWPSKSWKNKHVGTGMPRGRPRKNFGLKNFGLMYLLTYCYVPYLYACMCCWRFFSVRFRTNSWWLAVGMPTASSSEEAWTFLCRGAFIVKNFGLFFRSLEQAKFPASKTNSVTVRGLAQPLRTQGPLCC